MKGDLEIVKYLYENYYDGNEVQCITLVKCLNETCCDDNEAKTKRKRKYTNEGCINK